MKILLIIPQRNEFDYFIDGLIREGYQVDDATFGSIKGVIISELEISIATGGHGKAQFAAQTQHLIAHHPGDIDLVICAGASGALTEQVSLGDIIVGTKTIEHDYKLRFVEKPLPAHSGDPQAISQLRDIAQNYQFPFDIHFGKIASGDEDIIDPEDARALHTKTDALCVAWEGSGGARAAELSELPFLEVRVITDSADGSASEDFQKNLGKTIPNISSMLVRWLRDKTT